MSTKYQILAEGGVWDHETKSIVRPDKTSAAWKEYQKWLTAGGVPLPASTVTMDDLTTAKEKKNEEINAYAAGLRNSIVAGRSVGEMASWALKLFDGMAVAAGQPNPFQSVLPTLQTALGLPIPPTSYNHAIAMIRGISEAEHVGKVLAQAVPFLAGEAAIDGIRGKHCDAVNALTDVRDISTYDWKIGWPDLSQP